MDEANQKNSERWKNMKITKTEINDESRCFVIAEIGCNHQGDIGIADKMIQKAAEAGANAVKFQKRSIKDLYTTEEYNKPYENENSFGKTYGEHREALEFDFEQFQYLKTCAKNCYVSFIVTPFDIESVDFLEEVGVDASLCNRKSRRGAFEEFRRLSGHRLCHTGEQRHS